MSRCPICYLKGRARSGMLRHAWACPGMSGHVPAESRRQAPEAGRQPSHPIRSRHGALGHQSPLSPRFLPYMGAGPGYKTLPHPSYLADSLCFADPLRFLAHLPPGVLPESDCPIKGPDQWSIGVALSSRGVSYTLDLSFFFNSLILPFLNYTLVSTLGFLWKE